MKDSYLQNMKTLLKEDYESYLKSLQNPPVRGIQVNLHKGSVKNFLEKTELILEKIPYTENGFILIENTKMGKDPLYKAGAYYGQEPSSMIPISAISIKEGSLVLDLCASPGGKSIDILNALNETGFLVSNEYNTKRANILLSNLEKTGFSNFMITNLDILSLSKLYQGVFDVVVLDSPCSGEGMFRKDEKAQNVWHEDLPYKCQQRSLELIELAKKLVKQNGILVYSTCTFNRQENEEVIKKALEDNYFIQLKATDKIIQVTKEGYPFTKTRRFYPHLAKGEGQVVSILKRTAENTSLPFKSSLKNLSKKDEGIVQEFIKANLTTFPLQIFKYHDSIIALPNNLLNIPDYKVLRIGVKLGEIKNERFIPHHHFFISLSHLFIRKINFNKNDDNLKKYLRGEEIQNIDISNGYGVIEIEGYSLGGFKAVNHTLKNYYPKGLRDIS